MAPLIALLMLGFAGLGLTLYMTRIYFLVQRGADARCIDPGCPVAMKSPYSRIMGIPTPHLAIPYYLGLALFALLSLAGRGSWLLVPVTAAAAAAVALSAYLVHALVRRVGVT